MLYWFHVMHVTARPSNWCRVFLFWMTVLWVMVWFNTTVTCLAMYWILFRRMRYTTITTFPLSIYWRIAETTWEVASLVPSSCLALTMAPFWGLASTWVGPFACIYTHIECIFWACFSDCMIALTYFTVCSQSLMVLSFVIYIRSWSCTCFWLLWIKKRNFTTYP